MGNQFFRFKQFTVHQDACAMKVCTDACLQGAFTADWLKKNQPGIRQVMDIGTGTGLLSLMLAQELPDAHITAVELDQAAAGQATGNFNASPWSERLQVTEQDARSLPSTHSFDFIITNPPFYEGDLKSDDQLRNQAMHATTLDYRALLTVIDNQLSATGSFSVLLPYKPFTLFEELARNAGFHMQEVVHVKQGAQHGYFRSIGIFGRVQQSPIVHSMAIRDLDHKQYTAAFIALLQPYYLYL